MGLPQVDFVKTMALADELDDWAMAVKWFAKRGVADRTPPCAAATASD